MAGLLINLRSDISFEEDELVRILESYGFELFNEKAPRKVYGHRNFPIEVSYLRTEIYPYADPIVRIERYQYEIHSLTELESYIQTGKVLVQ